MWPLALGLKNWVHRGSEEARPKVAKLTPDAWKASHPANFRASSMPIKTIPDPPGPGRCPRADSHGSSHVTSPQDIHSQLLRHG